LARKAKEAEQAKALAAMPTLNKVLTAESVPDGERNSALAHLATLNITEAEVLAIVAPEPQPKPRLKLAHRWNLVKYWFRHWRRNGNPVLRGLYLAGWLYLLVSAVVKLAWSPLAIVSAAAVVMAKIKFVVRDMRAKNMQLVAHGYNERKVQFQTLLAEAQEWYLKPPSPEQRQQFASRALHLVADYVRDHRARFGSRRILANLMVRDGNELVVIARSDHGVRAVPQRYSPDKCALVWKAFETSAAQVTGDLYQDFPDTTPGKKYASILVLPVWFEGRVIAAVSVDSEEKFHFNPDFDDLQVHVAPYVQLLAYPLVSAQSATVHQLGPVTS
jgi:hypothetical protein